MSRINRWLATVAPQAALRRETAQVKFKALMNYDGASRGRRTAGWKATGTDADAAAFGSRARLRQISRDMIRNRPYAVRGQAVVVNNVVGSGAVPSIDNDSADQKTKLEELVIGHLNSKQLDTFGDLNIKGIQRVAMNAVFESGEVLLRRRMRDTTRDPNLLLPFQVQLMEADHLDDSLTSHGGNEIREGVEYDQWGKVVAYWLFDQHPGSASLSKDYKSKRVAASEIIHVRRLDRPAQTRGVPWLAPVILTMGELSDYQEAQNLKQKISALLAGVIESDASDGAVSFEEDDLPGLEDLAPGALVHAKSGQKVNWSSPPTVDGYDQVMRQGLAACAMGLGLTYESLAGDLSRVNFASGKMGRMEMDRNIETWQQEILIDQLCGGIGQWCREALPLVVPERRALWVIKWTPQRRPLIDPTREVKAMTAQIDAKLTSRQRVIRQLGGDPAVVRAERLEDSKDDKTDNPTETETNGENNA